MRTAVITFPGSNCDRDLAVALEQTFGRPPERIWHADRDLPEVDLIGVPGGFAYGDYLRVGAIAARSPIMTEVAKRARDGVAVIGICNGFQVLLEAGLLPGALIKNCGLAFVCRWVKLRVGTVASRFTADYPPDAALRLPVAHHDGNYIVDPEGLAQLEGEDRIAFRYDQDNPNGSTADIAGILNQGRNVLGMMPHPERAADRLLGGTDGQQLFASLLRAVG